MISHMAQEDWDKARLTMETEARNRDSAARFARLLMVDGDSEIAATLKAKIKVNSEGNGAALKETRAAAQLRRGEDAVRRGEHGA